VFRPVVVDVFLNLPSHHLVTQKEKEKVGELVRGPVHEHAARRTCSSHPNLQWMKVSGHSLSRCASTSLFLSCAKQPLGQGSSAGHVCMCSWFARVR
jgi:hypothetical protein